MNVLKFCFLAACFICALPTFARDYVVAFSPHQTSDATKAQATQILQFATGLTGGDQITFIDGYNLATIGTFSVPDDPRYKSPKARLNVNRNAVSTLMNFAGKTSGNGNVLHVPKLLRHIAQNRNGDTFPEIILLGSPFFNDPADPNFSMLGGLVPSDGHITASRADTPFGTKDYPNALKDLRIHWFVMGDRAFQSDQHRFYVERFWTLFIEAQGGKLITYSTDFATSLHRTQSGAQGNPHNFTLEKTSKLGMTRFVQSNSDEPPLFDRPISDKPLPGDCVRRADNVQIGIEWHCPACDLDLYVHLNGLENPIYFGNSETPEGTFWKYYLKDKPSIGGFETIVMNGPIDLRRITLAVNFFEGEARDGIAGALRLSANGKTYETPFVLSAASGNFAKHSNLDFAGKPSDAHTVYVDPLALVSLQ